LPCGGAWLRPAPGPDTADAGDLLSDHQGRPNSICRHPDPAVPLMLQADSLGSFIMLPAQRVMLVAAGNPCTHEYLRYGVAGG
jgi:isopenicillin-N N-acyltransferase-like protein